MDFDAIYTAFYTQFRADSDIPTSTEAEYTVGLRLANEAINRWSNYEGTYWKELFTNVIDAADGDKTVATGDTTYAAPTNFREAGGHLRLRDATTNEIKSTIAIVEPHEDQFIRDSKNVCYFTGNPKDGYTLNLNKTPDATNNGDVLDYVYYQKPTEFTTGTDVSEMADPYFIVHRMLAQQLRASRNPYYSSALRDAENVLTTMQTDNNAGSWANPWEIADTSGSGWGI